MSVTNPTTTRTVGSFVPDMPMVFWMVFITVVLALGGGLSADTIVGTYNVGFGRALGEFALILLPAFVLAAAMSLHKSTPAAGLATAVSPVAGAGMICPDTAYAALSPIAGRQKIDVAFGSYAGFKLLYPAGPLIVATGLGVEQASIAFYGLALLIPVWAVGFIWARSIGAVENEDRATRGKAPNLQQLRPLAPFAVLAILLVLGALFDLTSVSVFDFLTQPIGALLLAALLAMSSVPAAQRRGCLDSALRRTGSLLLVIGAASAFGAVLTALVPMDDIISAEAGVAGILGLFALTALFKLAQGSSMATFAAVAPVAAPIVASSDMSSIAAVFAICLGSFVAILPNDSFYWLTRNDALESTKGDGRAIWILAGGTVAQALTGLAALIAAVLLGIA